MKVAKEVINHIRKVTGINIVPVTRKREVVDLRVIYAQILLKNTNYTTIETGKYIGKDHATIIHYRKQFNNLITYPEFRSLYNKIVLGLNFDNENTLEDLGWQDIPEQLINDILKIYK